MKLSIIIPVYNEVAAFPILLEKVRTCNLPIDREIIIVDDYSTDGSRALCERLSEVTLILHDRNQGKGAAIRSGIEHATGDLIIIQDADLEYDPNDYARLVAPVIAGEADVVYGSRFLDRRNSFGTLSYIANVFLTLLTRLLIRWPVTDMETCYKVFKTPILKSLNVKENRFGFEPEVTVKLSLIPGLRYKEVPVSYTARTRREGKKIGWRDGVRAVWALFAYRVRIARGLDTAQKS